MIPVVVVAVHVVVRPEGHVHGPGDTLSDFLRRAHVPHLTIYHALGGGHPSRAVQYGADGTSRTWPLGDGRRRPLLWQAWREIRATVRCVQALGQPVPLFIGIDPVNAWAGAWLKRQGRVRRLVFYTADYAVRRYAAPWLNGIYQTADRVAVQAADVVWNVSSRIVAHREASGVARERLRLVPNAPSLAAIPNDPASSADPCAIISMATTDSMENRLLIEAVAILRRELPAVRLAIVGVTDGGQGLAELAARHGVADAVDVAGLRPHAELLQRLCRAAVGVALYTEAQPWTRFGDAKKVREYLACGLPVVMTGVPSTADDVAEAGAGLIVPLERGAVVAALRRLLTDAALATSCRRAARRLAEQWDSDRVFSQELSRLGVVIPSKIGYSTARPPDA